MKPPILQLSDYLHAASSADLPQAIVNAPFRHKLEMVSLGIGIIVLLVADKESKAIYRVALSQTNQAEGTLQITSKEFKSIIIPSDDKNNIIARVIHDRQHLMTADWYYLFTPALSPEQARLNQAGGGIEASYVYPLTFNSHAGAMIFSFYKTIAEIDDDAELFMEAYSNLVSNALTEANIDPARLIHS